MKNLHDEKKNTNMNVIQALKKLYISYNPTLFNHTNENFKDMVI